MLQPHQIFGLIFGISALSVASCTEAEVSNLPAAVKVLEAEGLVIMQEFATGSEIRAFAAAAGDQPIAVYLTKDGNTIVGTRLSPEGKRLDEAKLIELVAKPKAASDWAKLEASEWVLDGKADAPRIVYVFSDPNCPYCNKFWQLSRPWVDAGKVQLRHIIVGIIREDSANKAAAILSASDQESALHHNESHYAQGGIAPLVQIPTAIQSTLDKHQQLMYSLGLRGTPGIIVLTEQGEIRKFSGMPQAAAIGEIFGSR